jgi:hypothetical protein
VDFIDRLQVSDSGFAFDPQTGSTFSLNHTGIIVITLMREGKTKEQVAEAIVKEYGAEPTDALRDVEDFTQTLRQFTSA